MPNDQGRALREAEGRQQNGILRDLYRDRGEAFGPAPVEQGVVVREVDYTAVSSRREKAWVRFLNRHGSGPTMTKGPPPKAT